MDYFSDIKWREHDDKYFVIYGQERGLRKEPNMQSREPDCVVRDSWDHVDVACAL